MRCRCIWIGLTLIACGDDRAAPGAAMHDDEPAATTTPPAPTPHVADRARAACAEPALHYDDGLARGWLCPDDARSLGLTLVDLSEQWAPRPFAAGPDGKAPRFRDTYLALAAEEDPDGGELPPEERLVEIYGVTPALSVILRRLTDERRHACHDAVADDALAELTWTVAEARNAAVDRRQQRRRVLARTLEAARKARKLADVGALAAVPAYRWELDTWKKLDVEHRAVRAAQEHLVCDGLLAKKWVDGRLIWLTADKLDLYQRSHFLLPHGELDADTREAMLAGSRELAFRAALRVLRERVVDATGLIEDGSAGTGALPVLGRDLEPDTMRHAAGHEPLPDAAPDRIGPATEAAALELGWTAPELVRDFIVRHKGERLIVALDLPPPPAYHTPHMALRAVLDRGDVWYDTKPPAKPRKVERRPALVLYATVDGKEVPLVRWPSTIGGWADEAVGRRVVKKWKESDVGKRVWKELYVAPTWQPPDTTPDHELMRNLWWNGTWTVKREVFGPSPRSAYGLVMLIHHKPVPIAKDRKTGKTKYYWADHGIRVHGTSGVASVIRGTSHGCHRLLNHLAVRLGSFLIRHRNHVVRGDQKDNYRRIVRHPSGAYPVRIDTRGYLYELTPPIAVEVTKGRIRSARKKPPK